MDPAVSDEIPGARVQTDLKSYPTEVVGERHYQQTLKRIAGGHARNSQKLEVTAVLALDPGNKHDPNAVKVMIRGQTVGYLSADDAVRVGGLMREQGIRTAAVDGQICGGWRTNQHDSGYFGVRVKLPRANWIDFGVGAARPREPRRSPDRAAFSNANQTTAPDGPLNGQRVFLWGFDKDSEMARQIREAGGLVVSSVGK